MKPSTLTRTLTCMDRQKATHPDRQTGTDRQTQKHKHYTLHPTPYTLHPTPFSLHPTPYTLHPTTYNLQLSPQTNTKTYTPPHTCTDRQTHKQADAA
eukprot:296392-Rhodomonas_salina.1